MAKGSGSDAKTKRCRQVASDPILNTNLAVNLILLQKQTHSKYSLV
jgi:hypothetical protein